MQSSDDKQVEVIAMIFQSAAATQRSTQYGVGFYGGDPDCETWGNCRQFGILGSVFWVLGTGLWVQEKRGTCRVAYHN